MRPFVSPRDKVVVTMAFIVFAGAMILDGFYFLKLAHEHMGEIAATTPSDAR